MRFRASFKQVLFAPERNFDCIFVHCSWGKIRYTLSEINYWRKKEKGVCIFAKLTVFYICIIQVRFLYFLTRKHSHTHTAHKATETVTNVWERGRGAEFSLSRKKVRKERARKIVSSFVSRTDFFCAGESGLLFPSSDLKVNNKSKSKKELLLKWKYFNKPGFS